MKKIFYILAAAIVALGTVACENEGLDNINPNINVDGDTVSFVAGINRTDLEGTATVWDADDTIVVTWNGNNYEFKNAETGDKNTFKCTADGLSAIVDAESIKAVYSNNKDGKVDSAAGVAGALLEYEGAFGNIAFEVKNAFLKFKANAGSEVKFTASAEIFSTGTELTLTATGEDQYVAVIPATTTITYALDGVVCTTSEENTLKACKIYPLSNLEKVVVIKTKEDFLTFAEAVNNGTSYEGYTVKLNNNIDLEDAANTLSIVVKNNNITLDLNGKTLTANNTRTATHNFFFDVNAGGVLTVENGSIVYTHTGTNMGWNGAATAFDVTGGGVLNMNGVNVTVSGTDMNFCVHLNNWGEVTFNADGCKFNATYCGVRVFNSGYDMNNVTIKNSHMTGATRAFWVQMYIGDSLSKPETHPNDARKARLNFDIFGNNNTYALTGEATSPVRYGQTASIYFNPENGNQVLGNATDLSRFAQYVNEGIENYKGKTVELVKDIDLTEAWTPVGQTGATQFHGTFDGQGHTIKGLTINAPESYSTNYATGMFGWVETGAVIKNIVLDDANINGYHYVGAIAGYMSGSAKIEGCKVINSKIVADPTKKDTAGEFNGDKVGGIVGYTNGSNVISGNEVSKTTIKGYRHMGGIVGYLLGTAENNTVDDTVVITVNNDNNYKKYAIQGNYGVNNIAGVVTGSATNNNGEVTIVWGDIPASLAVQVGSTKYGTIKAAIAAAESGATITLLEDIALEGLTEGALMKVDKNLTLNVGEHTLTATLPTATKNASIFTVTKGAEFTLVGAGNIVIENGGGSNIGNHFISNEGGIVNLDMDGGIELNVVGTPFINCIVDNNSTLGAATLNVKKGTYKQNSGNIFRNFVNHKTELATINISGGSIIGTGEKAIYIWNQKMGKTTGILNITAGTFVNVQIDNDDATLNQVTFTAEGYKLQQNANGYYDVVEWNPVASVGGVEYESFEAALEAAEAGSTIELLAPINDATTLDKACTIDTKGFAFNYTVATGFRETKNGNIITVVKLEASVWSIIGDKTGWTDDITMYNTETANVFVAYNVTFEESTASQGDNASYNEFKIRKDKAWTTQYGAGACVQAGYKANHSLGRNTGVEENGTYDIYFNSSTKQIAVMPVGQTWSDAKDPKFDDGTSSGTCAWGITGSMNGWGTNDVTMYFDGTYWYAKGVQFEQNDEFKLRENAAWGWNYGANNKQNATNIGTNGDNIKATAKCCYDVYVSKTQHKVWFKAAGQRP